MHKEIKRGRRHKLGEVTIEDDGRFSVRPELRRTTRERTDPQRKTEGAPRVRDLTTPELISAERYDPYPNQFHFSAVIEIFQSYVCGICKLFDTQRIIYWSITFRRGRGDSQNYSDGSTEKQIPIATQIRVPPTQIEPFRR